MRTKSLLSVGIITIILLVISCEEENDSKSTFSDVIISNYEISLLEDNTVRVFCETIPPVKNVEEYGIYYSKRNDELDFKTSQKKAERADSLLGTFMHQLNDIEAGIQYKAKAYLIKDGNRLESEIKILQSSHIEIVPSEFHENDTTVIWAHNFPSEVENIRVQVDDLDCVILNYKKYATGTKIVFKVPNYIPEEEVNLEVILYPERIKFEYPVIIIK